MTMNNITLMGCCEVLHFNLQCQARGYNTRIRAGATCGCHGHSNERQTLKTSLDPWWSLCDAVTVTALPRVQ